MHRNQLQNVEVQGMSPKPTEESKEPDDLRLLDSRLYMVHYSHLQSNIPKAAGCLFCTGGLGAITQTVAPMEPGDSVVPGDGADATKDNPLPSSGGEPTSITPYIL